MATPHVIYQFMWAYQHSLRVTLEIASKKVLGELGPDLEPKALLVGVLRPGAQDEPACVEPEDGPCKVELFDGIETRIAELIEGHELRNVFYGDEPSNRDKPGRIRADAIRNAVRERLEPYDREAGTRSFCGLPGAVGNYDVVPVIQVARDAFARLPRLTKDSCRDGSIKLTPSLFEAVVGHLLWNTKTELYKPEPGRYSTDTLTQDPTSTLREAGQTFMLTPSWAIGNIMGMGALFDACNRISATAYESSTGLGQMIIAPLDHPSIEAALVFETPVPLTSTSWARKTLQMASDSYALISDGKNILGVGRARPDYDVSREDLFVIHFIGHYAWDLRHGGRTLMRTRYAVPGLPKPRLDRGRFVSNLRRVIPEVSESGSKDIWELVDTASRQGHGTLVVIGAGAAQESERLRKQATRIKPVPLTEELVAQVSRIDGAILVDPTACCHAVGVILDGVATEEGTAARGARYNSAIRYRRAAKFATVAVVISEDGQIDVSPMLRPQISKATVESTVTSLEALVDKPDLDRILKASNWLDDHRFYLSPDQCRRANAAMKPLEQFVMSNGWIWINYPPFTPHPEMDDSYFLPEDTEAR
jgi:hypothetical protein